MPNPPLKSLKARAHGLKVVVIIGQSGLTESVLKEIETALYAHECIKIRVNAESKSDRSDIIQSACEALNATLVQCIGHTAVLFKARDDNN